MTPQILLRIAAIMHHALFSRLGLRAEWVLLGLLRKRGAYLGRFLRPGEPEGLQSYKRRLVWFAALYYELIPEIGAEEALTLTRSVVDRVALLVQRAEQAKRRGDRLANFVDLHTAQRSSGFFRHIVYDDIQHDGGSYSFCVTRCGFHEAFREMGVPELTKAFCASDEIVYNEISPRVHFSRPGGEPSTIARGAERCRFLLVEE